MNRKVWSVENKNKLFDTSYCDHTCIDTNFCTEERRKKCEEKQMCDEYRPRMGLMGKYQFIGKSYIDTIKNNKVIPEDKLDAMIDEKLRKIFKRCRSYEIIIK